MTERASETEKWLTFVVVLLLSVPAVVLNGWAFSVLWLWFLCPLGVQPIGAAHAIGMNCLLTFFLKPRTDQNESPWAALGFAYIKPAVYLGVGYVAARVAGL